MAVSWSEQMLTALTLPHQEPDRAVYTLAGQLKVPLKLLVKSDQVPELIVQLEKQLQHFFLGERCSFNFKVDLSWCTPFQRSVLQAARLIPYGETRTYKQLAGMIENPRACRAVGGALRGNRVLLVVPCHRIIRHDGTPGGFGGQPWWKEKLINLEKSICLKNHVHY